LVWNYKYADLEFGRLQARDLLQHLCTGPISNAPVDIVQGARSVEARPVSVSKGMAMQTLMTWMRDAAGFAAVDFEYILCVGHFLGRDENLFTFLNGDGIGAHGKEHAHHGHAHEGGSDGGLKGRNVSIRTVGFMEPPGPLATLQPGDREGEPEAVTPNGARRSPEGGATSTSLLTNMVRVLDLEAERGRRIPGWRASKNSETRGGDGEEDSAVRERDTEMAAQRRRTSNVRGKARPPFKAIPPSRWCKIESIIYGQHFIRGRHSYLWSEVCRG
jgi:hypothetical protein